MLESGSAEGSAPEQQAAFYKAQYEQLEAELREFQASSQELEAELERDVEASEKREQKLKDQVDALTTELEALKTRHRQSKLDANTTQQSLQKEVTSLREANRTLQLRLRDVEVVNDDFERQARFTTTSLEDMESKYNMAVQRAAMLEQEAKAADVEREELRVDAQRLRDELSDLKVEAEITQSKLDKLEATLRTADAGSSAAHPQGRNTNANSIDTASPRSGTSRATSADHGSRSDPSTAGTDITAPSPATSEILAIMKRSASNATPTRRSEHSTTNPDPDHAPLHSPDFSTGASTAGYFAVPRKPSFLSRDMCKPSLRRTRPSSGGGGGTPDERPHRTESLHQIRGLIGKMQLLEERVQSARLKLPAGAAGREAGRQTPRSESRAETETGSEVDGDVESSMLASVTVRSLRRRVSAASTERLGMERTEPDRRSDASFHDAATRTPARRVISASESGQGVADPAIITTTATTTTAAQKASASGLPPTPSPSPTPHPTTTTSSSFSASTPIHHPPSPSPARLPRPKPDTPRPIRSTTRHTSLATARRDATAHPHLLSSLHPHPPAPRLATASTTTMTRRDDTPRPRPSRASLAAASTGLPSPAPLASTGFGQSRGPGGVRRGELGTPTRRPGSRAAGEGGGGGSVRRIGGGAVERSYMASTASRAGKVRELGGEEAQVGVEAEGEWDLEETF